MSSETPTLSPEEVGCYEECVVTDHFGLLVSPTPAAGSQPSSLFAEGATDRAGIPKSSSGKVTKKSTVWFLFHLFVMHSDPKGKVCFRSKLVFQCCPQYLWKFTQSCFEVVRLILSPLPCSFYSLLLFISSGRPRPRTPKDKKCSSPLIMKWYIQWFLTHSMRYKYKFLSCDSLKLTHVGQWARCTLFDTLPLLPSGLVIITRTPLAAVCHAAYFILTTRTFAKGTSSNHPLPPALERWGLCNSRKNWFLNIVL